MTQKPEDYLFSGGVSSGQGVTFGPVGPLFQGQRPYTEKRAFRCRAGAPVGLFLFNEFRAAHKDGAQKIDAQ